MRFNFLGKPCVVTDGSKTFDISKDATLQVYDCGNQWEFSCNIKSNKLNVNFIVFNENPQLAANEVTKRLKDLNKNLTKLLKNS